MLRPTVAAILATLFSITVAAADPGPAKEVPELEALNHWVGQSNVRIKKPVSRTGESHAEWTTAGRYLKQTWKLDADNGNPELSATVIMTYDDKMKVYRQWNFMSDGFTSNATGKWDAATKTMTWTDRNADSGLTTSTKSQFPEAGVEHFTITATDKDGNVVFEMSGQNKRRK